LCRILGLEILHDSPKKADELAGGCDDGDLRRFLSIQAVEELEETMLSLPSMSDDVGRLAHLAFLELSRDGRPISIFPCSLNEDVATATVAGLGNGALADAIPGGVFGRDKAEESHELRRPLKTPPVSDLGNEGHGGQRADAPETGEPLDEGPVQGGEGDGLDLFVEVVTAAGLVVEESEILGEDGAILWGEGAGLEEALQPFTVKLAPVTRLAEDEITSAQELEDVVARAEDLALEALTTTHEIPDPLFGRRGDTNGGELTDSVEPAKLGGIVAIVLTPFAGPGGNEGRSDDVTVDPPGGDRTVENVAGPTRFVASTNLTPSCPPVEEPAELAEIVGELFDDLGLGSVIDKDGNHDGVLVDVHPDVNDGARHGAGPPIGCDLESRMWHWHETGTEPR
jgi:hypothetical protein